MQGHSAPPATSTTHQLVAQPRKVREGCVTTVFSHRMISRSWSTENGVSPPLSAKHTRTRTHAHEGLRDPPTRTYVHPHTRTHARTHACIFLFRVPPSLGRPFSRTPSRAPRTHAPARTRAHERPTTNDATCGPPAWLTGRLHEGGIRSVRSPLGGPLSSRPLSPRPCKAAAPKGPAFCFLNY